MGASLRNTLLVSTALLLGVAACASETDVEPSQPEIIDFLKSRVATATTQLAEQIEVCEKKVHINNVPKFDEKRLAELGVRPADIVVALGHLSFANRFQCEKQQRLILAYEVGTLKAAQREFGIDTSDVELIQAGLVYPSVREVQYSVEFSKLAPEIKSHFEEKIGNEPFNLMNALEAHSGFLNAGP